MRVVVTDGRRFVMDRDLNTALNKLTQEVPTTTSPAESVQEFSLPVAIPGLDGLL